MGGAGRSFRAATRRVYGVPLRAGFGPRAYAPRATARVLVLGGRQGAAALNERMPAVAARLREVPNLEVVHQAGRDRDGPVRAAYEREGVLGVSVVPFIEDVSLALRRSRCR